MTFTVPGPPVPKGRPRVVRRAGKTRTFTPKRTVAYETRVRLCALQAALRTEWPLRQRASYAVALRVFGARANADTDNLAKALLDGMEDVCFANDRQVTRLSVERCPVDADGPRVECVVEVLA